MKGKTKFTSTEIDRIRNLLQRKIHSDRNEQKTIRNSIRNIGFYISDFTDSTDGFTPSCLDDLIANGSIIITDTTPNIITITPPKTHSGPKLEDLLELNLKLVICGTAAGKKSAELRQYYAGNGNMFWDILVNVGLTPERLKPSEYRKLLIYGIGLTDIAKYQSGSDSGLVQSDFDIKSTSEKILHYNPKYLCFNGKTSASIFLNRSVDYGLQTERIGITRIFVAPSTSGLARRSWDPKLWKEISRLCSM